MDEPLDFALGLGADRDHGAAVADRRLLLGGIALRRRLAERFEKRITKLTLPLAEGSGDPPQLGRGVVADLPPLVDGPADVLFELLLHGDLPREAGDLGIGLAARLEVAVRPPHRPEDGSDVREVFGLDRRLLRLGAAERFADVRQGRERERVVGAEGLLELGRLREETLDERTVGRGLHGFEPLAPERAAGMGEEPPADGVEAELLLRVVGVKLHRSRSEDSGRTVRRES